MARLGKQQAQRKQHGHGFAAAETPCRAKTNAAEGGKGHVIVTAPPRLSSCSATTPEETGVSTKQDICVVGKTQDFGTKTGLPTSWPLVITRPGPHMRMRRRIAAATIVRTPYAGNIKATAAQEPGRSGASLGWTSCPPSQELWVVVTHYPLKRRGGALDVPPKHPNADSESQHEANMNKITARALP